MTRRKRTTLRLAALFLLGAVLGSRGAAAQTPIEREEAAARYREGDALHQAHRDEEALVKYREAYLLAPTAANALSAMARAEELTHRLVEAMGHYQAYLDAPTATATGKDAVRKRIDDLAKQLGHLSIEAPAGAALTLDDKSLAATVRDVYALPGTHTLGGTLAGRSERQESTLTAGGSVTVKLFQAPASPPQVADAVPSSPVAPAPSTHAERAIDPPAETPSTFTTGRKIAVGIGVAAVAVVAVGVGFGVSASNAANDAASLRAGNGADSCSSTPSSARCVSLQSAGNTDRANAPVATGLFIGGAALAAGALAVWLLSPPRAASASAVRILPAVDHTGAGFRLVGEF